MEVHANDIEIELTDEQTDFAGQDAFTIDDVTLEGTQVFELDDALHELFPDDDVSDMSDEFDRHSIHSDD